ncbi:SDR family NAD(P)-dependent oxidoreductase [Enterocloster lavalensis]|uniref:SDR family NAD(P)-dependent oxidoreductase n=1 Tax=Enterocloster lavalensis TaxID=460384 RepID=UPI001D094A3C|nr:SDR family NAD(P)-dependent oxidoreductase [Enterocloster lavalensis]MCB6345833.1 SDR family oxidoreductase [Enterocloster lavalensis]
MIKKFADKVAVVTGATSGIGAACARKFVEEGAKVALVGRNQDRGNKLEQDLKALGGYAKFYGCDVADPEKVKDLAESIEQDFGQVDILFNNAGVMLPSKEIERMPIEDWQDTFNININGMFYVTRSLKPLLLESHGCIINNASIAGMQHYAAGRSYAYSASKAAVIQFSHQMAKNYGEEHIRVNCICPGIIDTRILGDRDRKIYAERIPMGYVGQPEDVAKVVAFLASEDAAYLTGVVLPIDGGASL